MPEDTQNLPQLPHYYGGAVRVLFLAAAVGMLVGIPSFLANVRFSPILLIGGALFLVLAAGLTNPARMWDSVINFSLSVLGFLISAVFAVGAYKERIDTGFFVVTILLSFVFLFALYFSMKTLRGFLIPDK